MANNTIQTNPRRRGEGGNVTSTANTAPHVAISNIDDGDDSPSGTTSANSIGEETMVESFATIDLDSIPAELKCSSRHIKEGCKAIEAGNRLLVAHAWRCGHLLNHAKLAVKKGKSKWTPWLEKHWEKGCKQSTRTAQRYMAIARRHSSVEDLFNCGKSLREIYITLGMLKPLVGTAPVDGRKGGRGLKTSAQAPTWQEVQTSVAAILKDLRELNRVSEVLGKTGEALPPETREQVEIARTQISQFFATILGDASTQQ